MNDQRIEFLADLVWCDVFEILDTEPDAVGDEAGAVAAAVRTAFVAAMLDTINSPAVVAGRLPNES